MQVRLYGSGRWAPVWETAGMSACCLLGSSCWWMPCCLRLECAGQGAHREVGSEGFEAKGGLYLNQVREGVASRHGRAAIAGAGDRSGRGGRRPPGRGLTTRS